MSTAAKKILLMSSDGEYFEVDESISLMSQIIKQKIADGCDNGVVPLPNVTAYILAKIIEYCNKHGSKPHSNTATTGNSTVPDVDPQILAWDRDFVDVDYPLLLELLEAARYLDIKDLVDLIIRAVDENV